MQSCTFASNIPAFISGKIVILQDTTNTKKSVLLNNKLRAVTSKIKTLIRSQEKHQNLNNLINKAIRV